MLNFNEAKIANCNWWPAVTNWADLLRFYFIKILSLSLRFSLPMIWFSFREKVFILKCVSRRIPFPLRASAMLFSIHFSLSNSKGKDGLASLWPSAINDITLTFQRNQLRTIAWLLAGINQTGASRGKQKKNRRRNWENWRNDRTPEWIMNSHTHTRTNTYHWMSLTVNSDRKLCIEWI